MDLNNDGTITEEEMRKYNEMYAAIKSENTAVELAKREALERWGPFFGSPLFAKDATRREVEAINSEHGRCCSPLRAAAPASRAKSTPRRGGSTRTS